MCSFPRIKLRILEHAISACAMPANAIFGPLVAATSPIAKMLRELISSPSTCSVGATRIKPSSVMAFGREVLSMLEFGFCPVQDICEGQLVSISSGKNHQCNFFTTRSNISVCPFLNTISVFSDINGFPSSGIGIAGRSLKRTFTPNSCIFLKTTSCN